MRLARDPISRWLHWNVAVDVHYLLVRFFLLFFFLPDIAFAVRRRPIQRDAPEY